MRARTHIQHTCFRPRDPSIRVDSVKSSSSSSFLFFFSLPQCTELAQYGLSTPLSTSKLEHLHKSYYFTGTNAKINFRFRRGIGSGSCFMSRRCESQKGILGRKDWQNEAEAIRSCLSAGFCFALYLCCLLSWRQRLLRSSRSYIYLVLSDVISGRRWAHTYIHSTIPQLSLISSPVHCLQAYVPLWCACRGHYRVILLFYSVLCSKIYKTKIAISIQNLKVKRHIT